MSAHSAQGSYDGKYSFYLVLEGFWVLDIYSQLCKKGILFIYYIHKKEKEHHSLVPVSLRVC